MEEVYRRPQVSPGIVGATCGTGSSELMVYPMSGIAHDMVDMIMVCPTKLCYKLAVSRRDLHT
jgi:hypothetical protein